ncbi:MAG: hypothetical protein U5L08_06385 [Xanthomonadales bacterium]|nr:hypothetical protein [Xanthomonadales bacterium]
MSKPESIPFDLQSDFQPAGDQPQAIKEIVQGLEAGEKDQVLLGVTGSGKTFTMAHRRSQQAQRPALDAGARNKTLAAQLYTRDERLLSRITRWKYFVSYYDYYQPEAYVPRTDTYVEKESSINEQIDRMRHAGDPGASGARRRDDRRLGLLHLRHRLGRRPTRR